MFNNFILQYFVTFRKGIDKISFLHKIVLLKTKRAGRSGVDRYFCKVEVSGSIPDRSI